MIRKKILQRAFYERSAEVVAQELLGKFLVKGKMARMVTDVEAYDGTKDKACHARHGKTSRNAPMFGGGGVWYVYFVYGMHHMLNVVTRGSGEPAAVLIRGVGGASGPGRVTKLFGITTALNSSSAAELDGLVIEDHGATLPYKKIKRGPRIGVAYAGPYWSKRKWRFYIE